MDILTINDRPGEYPRSWYAATATPLPPFTPAQGEINCDICIIGGGYTGLSAALHLAQAGYDVVVVEANRLGSGASGRNGGQVGTGQRLDQDELEQIVGKMRARALWDLALESVALVKDLIRKHDIACAWRDGIIHADHRARLVAHSHAYADKLNRDYGYDLIRPLERAEIRELVGSCGYHGGTLDMGSGHLHPLNYALGLARAAQSAGVRIYEQTRARDITPGRTPRITTDGATITADHVIIAANGYLGNLSPRLARRIMPINNYIVATEPLSEDFARGLIREGHAVADSRFVINYFRLSEDRRMLFGGGESYGYRFPRDIAALVRKPMLQVYPQLADTRIDYAWGGTLGITMSRLPHFTRMQGNILSAGGFSGHGVAMASLAGRLLAEAVQGQAERFDLMASLPTPRFPGGTLLRWPLLVLAMTWFSLRDRL
ncbi:MAG: FAD-binding oxidoreductase [Paracoccaceae bacterium]|nr:FAD-binding oxidoreductase [Paracoccaceae bacterium]